MTKILDCRDTRNIPQYSEGDLHQTYNKTQIKWRKSKNKSSKIEQDKVVHTHHKNSIEY